MKLLNFLIGCALTALVSRSAQASALLKPSSGATQALAAKSLVIDARIDGAFAKTTLTTIYKNPNARRIEADFLYSAPAGSVVTGFAYWFGAEKVVARVTEKQRAARIYSYITTRQRDPALVEMIGKNAFRARIFPVEANQDLKIEVKLAQKLESRREGLVWNYPLRGETKVALESLKIHLESSDANIKTSLGSFQAGKLDFARENVLDAADLTVSIPKNPTPLRASLLSRRESAGGDGFFALLLAPASPVALPRLKIAGAGTYDVWAPQKRSLGAGEPFLVFGRYKKGGRAIVALNGQSVSLDFGDKIETGSAAASFWAQTRIETLAENPKNQFEVVKMSQRFGLVSKWTSWLAIPRSERARFQREVDVADRANAGRAYAQAIASNDRATARNQRLIFARLSKKLGEDAPIAEFLNTELEIVSASIESARGDRKQRANLAKWRGLQRVLVRNGAKSRRDEYAIQERAYAEMGKLAPLYVTAMENKDAAGARRLKNRMMALSNLRAVRGNGDEWMKNSIGNGVNERNSQLAQIIALERAENRLTAMRERDLLARIRRILPLQQQYNENNFQEILQNGQLQVVEAKTAAALQTSKNAITLGRPFAEATRDFDATWSEWENRVGAKNLARYSVNQVFKEAMAVRLAGEVSAGRDLEAPNVELFGELKKLEKSTDSTDSRVRHAYTGRATETAKQLLAEQLENGVQTPRARSLEAEVARLAAASQYQNEFYLRGAASKIRSDAKQQIADEVAKYAENSPAARIAQGKLVKLGAIDPKYLAYGDGYYYGNQGDYDLDKTWRGRAHESAYRLLEAQEKTPSDAAKVAKLQRDLSAEAAEAQKKPEDFTNWEKMRRKAGEPLLTAQGYRVRWGDPLISVLAPPSCQKVVAIMPDGTLLPLRFEVAKGAWEARFDVPVWASEGDYRVQILIVDAAGKRKRLTMNFALDVSVPRGIGGVEKSAKIWNLKLQSDEMGDRVSAFLPWGERIELRRDESGVFTARVELPTGFEAKTSSEAKTSVVRFILTDKAHNRTEISVDGGR